MQIFFHQILKRVCVCVCETDAQEALMFLEKCCLNQKKLPLICSALIYLQKHLNPCFFAQLQDIG